ncbi:hypothetical protein RF11_16207 [Thelohanellus kitauei]|uniref:Uncharacterized protein n=1 Tax=Thelohanellus kitauei TaxID=669202 RepID=A0A0C2M2G8_THEKT|nr:hypothetical protein RF11_14715 [Thelohanellus kitauei]KII62543.1 hypothetical protein RF11_16207 [Thelohanellus kitauei]
MAANKSRLGNGVNVLQLGATPYLYCVQKGGITPITTLQVCGQRRIRDLFIVRAINAAVQVYTPCNGGSNNWYKNDIILGIYLLRGSFARLDLTDHEKRFRCQYESDSMSKTAKPSNNI